ncbi:hypothetical protein M758_1G322300 [Ceratodon purpureus]|uniref:Neoxanthin synthase n=1 Tax=Ceratodon purpureus TaxID=3225 RepID=A0A8T0JC91_CERPU|nr:hypothetical protein KC19_1G329700 [Ceratodon purpureus]KAG0593437.1 hypothetical protein KC19_1G329700 [Ceratodon purpureus]KAG0632356.1 hypothetical protein M758_1G322300 [Ceratodon purpureus]KAG0632357.1 hypothetical protein M758_1G322300 [Ceratodon purpureus]KAG0632362.1 hypothetical protein M758_1G322300 [Ceratodon purpureus]
MARSCSMMRLVFRTPLQTSKNCTSITNLNFQNASCGFERTGIISIATTRNRFGHVSRSRQLSGKTRLPFVKRWEGSGLGAPLLPKAEALRIILGENSSKLVVCSLPVQVASSVQIASTIFTLGTAFVVPFYSVMIIAPKWKWTKKIVQSDLPFIALAMMYIYLLSLSWTSETAGLMFASKYYLPELPGITRMFSNTISVASAWIHLLVADLFCGRYVFLDGLQHKVETRHSLVLCLMMCPIGIISHLITKVLSPYDTTE